MIFYTLVILLLTILYAMAIASFQPWDLATGAAISTGLLLLCRPVMPTDQSQATPPLYWRALNLSLFIAAVWLDILKDTWRVVLMVLGIRPPRRPDFVEIAIGERSETGSAISGFVNTVSPGSYLVEVDRKRGVILFHVVDADDPESVREAYQRKYRQRQRSVFP
jgi:multisubunit Na+/H+ antiporter MnhE subunit